MDFDPPELCIEGFDARRLTETDLTALQALLESALDFSLLVDGIPPAVDAALSLLHDLPPTKDALDKFVFGFFDADDQLIGVLDCLRAYPDAATWWIGLLLFQPQARGSGMGKKVVDGFMRWVAQQGAACVGLGVVEANTEGLIFWQKLGFIEQERRPPSRFGEKEHRVVMMHKNIAQ